MPGGGTPNASFGLYDTIYPQTYAGWAGLAQNQLPYPYQASTGVNPMPAMTPYATPATGMGTGTGGAGSTGGLGTPYGTSNFTYPTPQDVHNTVYGLPWMQQQQNILGQLGSMDAFRSAVLPEVSGVMKALGRSGLPSSSYADRAITDTMGSLYNKWLWNALTGWQNIGQQMPGMMNQWYSPYNTMLNYVGS